MASFRLSCLLCSKTEGHAPHTIRHFNAIDADQALGIARDLPMGTSLIINVEQEAGGGWFPVHTITTNIITHVPPPSTKGKPEVDIPLTIAIDPVVEHKPFERKPIPLPAGFAQTSQCLKQLEFINGKADDECEEHTEHVLIFQEEFVYEAAEMILNGQNVLNGDEMGLGKTIEFILLCNYLDLWANGRVLVACPNSLRINWFNEIKKWAVGLPADIDENTVYCATQLYIPGFSNVIIATYEGIRRWVPLLKDEEWDMFVADEAHYLKTPGAQRTQATMSIPAKHLMFMSGTPILNYVKELYTLIHRLNPEVWSDFPSYENRYCRGVDNKMGTNLDELQAKLRGEWSFPDWYDKMGKGRYNRQQHRGSTYMTTVPKLMIRRLKKDVLDNLPNKRRQVITIPAEGKLAELVKMERMLYDQLSGGGDEYTDILTALGVLKDSGEGEASDQNFEEILMALTVNRKYLFEEISRIRHALALAKVPTIVEHLESILDAKDKVVVFCHHKDVASQLHKAVTEQLEAQNGGKSYSVIVTGDQEVPVRQERVEKFQNDENCRVFIGTMKAAGVGITLTESSHMVFAEMDWTPSVLNQAEDRCHRIGQKRSLLIQHLVVDGSMDAFMAKKVIAKQRSISKALNKTKNVGEWKT